MHLLRLRLWAPKSPQVYARTWRCFSAFKRPQFSAQSEHLATVRDKFFANSSEMSTEQWQTVTNTLVKDYKHINVANVEAIIVGLCSESRQLPLAKNYLQYLKAIGKEPNLATLGKMLRLYNSVYHDRGGLAHSLSVCEQEHLLHIYEKVREKHDTLDSITCENLIFGLVCTDKWKDGLQLIDMMKLTATPTLAALNEMARKAFTEHEVELGITLIESILELRKQPKCETYIKYIEAISKDKKTFYTNFERLLSTVGNNNVLISAEVVTMVEKTLTEHCGHSCVTRSSIDRSGKCRSCNHPLENVKMTHSDFYKLRDVFLDRVLVRDDVFRKSTPKEVKQFEEFVNTTGPYDCVIDGLNVAYSMGRKPVHVLAKLLANVVKYFKNLDKHVLVLGRKHMNKWPQPEMRYIRESAALFLANDLSQDDPFLLYAALKSGPETDIFSRDFMRQHSFLLGPEVKPIFRQWQQIHQYSLVTHTDRGKIVIRKPTRHLLTAHKIGMSWHVPYAMEYCQQITDSFEVPEHWLCIKYADNKIE